VRKHDQDQMSPALEAHLRLLTQLPKRTHVRSEPLMTAEEIARYKKTERMRIWREANRDYYNAQARKRRKLASGK
jgi:hypothetical protein